MITILQKETKSLRDRSVEVPVEEITSKKVKKVVADMKRALEGEDDGVAIAAPQIGKNLRIFVMSKRAFELVGTKPKPGKPFEDMVFINPKITKLSRKKIEEDEGCLSVRYLYGKVMRAEKATIEALDENGKKFISGGSGLIAQIFQHECDHLEGILFTDKARDLEEIPPKNQNVMNK